VPPQDSERLLVVRNNRILISKADKRGEGGGGRETLQLRGTKRGKKKKKSQDNHNFGDFGGQGAVVQPTVQNKRVGGETRIETPGSC